jgi:hypothetical protein
MPWKNIFHTVENPDFVSGSEMYLFRAGPGYR